MEAGRNWGRQAGRQAKNTHSQTHYPLDVWIKIPLTIHYFVFVLKLWMQIWTFEMVFIFCNGHVLFFWSEPNPAKSVYWPYWGFSIYITSTKNEIWYGYILDIVKSLRTGY